MLWSHEATLLLISAYGATKEDFSGRKKKDGWVRVSKAMAVHGYFYTTSDCDRKWRNLLKTYRKHIRRPMAKKWIYFDALDSVISMSTSSIPVSAASAPKKSASSSSLHDVREASSAPAERAKHSQKSTSSSVQDVHVHVHVDEASCSTPAKRVRLSQSQPPLSHSQPPEWFDSFVREFQANQSEFMQRLKGIPGTQATAACMAMGESSLKTVVFLGSVREGRMGLRVAKFITKQLETANHVVELFGNSGFLIFYTNVITIYRFFDTDRLYRALQPPLPPHGHI